MNSEKEKFDKAIEKACPIVEPEHEQTKLDLESTLVEIVKSGEEFPVDFDEAWQWISFSQKVHAKQSLYNNFVKDADFIGFLDPARKPHGGRPSERIMLTKDCFKAFCMLAQTDQGGRKLESTISKLRRGSLSSLIQNRKAKPYFN